MGISGIRSKQLRAPYGVSRARWVNLFQGFHSPEGMEFPDFSCRQRLTMLFTGVWGHAPPENFYDKHPQNWLKAAKALSHNESKYNFISFRDPYE